MLSGAIWKGAKLRVGEARPIWTERMALEREKQSAALRDEAARQQERHKKWPVSYTHLTLPTILLV